jgi:hypothetical protein
LPPWPRNTLVFKARSSDAELEQKFQQANDWVSAGDDAGAVSLLEEISRQARVPAIFNNLGVLYARLNDRARAINAFRETVGRATDYAPVRFNLDRGEALQPPTPGGNLKHAPEVQEGGPTTLQVWSQRRTTASIR